MSIVFPVVPIAPGVPPVSRDVASAIAIADLVTSDIITSLVTVPITWGIFYKGKIALAADSVVALENRKEWHIADYPIQEGDFESFNKVQIPFNVRVALSKGGTDTDRSRFISTLDQIAGTTNLYDVVTPEWIYGNVNIVRYDYRRTAVNGAKLLVADIVLQQVRSRAVTTFSNTAEPSGQPQQNTGVVQPAEVPGVGASSNSSTIDIDHLPGFSQPLVKYTELGFQ